MKISIARMPGTEDLPIPKYQSTGAAGLDLHCAAVESYWLQPGKRHYFPCGIKVAIPEGYVGLAFSRSGHGKNSGVCLANGVGVIDSDFRGQIGASLVNHGEDPFLVHRADRIAQLLVVPVMSVDWELVEELTQTERGEAGFGSTGAA